LRKFRKIDSKPTHSRPIGDNDNLMSWFGSSLDFLKGKKEWFILVTSYPRPVWANVRVCDFTKALEELWEKLEYRDLIIADKSTGNIAQIFTEDKDYEIHVGKCDTTNIE